VYALVAVALCWSGFVTTTLTTPGACALVVPVMTVAETAVAVSATPPTEAVAPVWKFVPLIVRAVLPALVPLAGETDVIVGAGAGAT